MAYADFEAYLAEYGDMMDEAEFERLLPTASRLLDAEVTGVDGVCKLRVSPPEDEYATDAVRRCVCALVNILYKLRAAEASAEAVRLASVTADGVVCGVISSVSAGSESISYKIPDTAGTSIDAAVLNPETRRKLISHTVAEYLSGIKDGRGVGLLYMGRYPYRV